MAAPWHWIAFVGFVLAMLALDLLVLSRGGHEPTFRESLGWTALWTGLAIGFTGLIWYAAGTEAAVRFLTGYLIEWSLSLDNVFVFLVIFAYFQVPRARQHRVLFWGILGAIVMRLVFVLAGMELIAAAEWVLPLFGIVIVYLGVKLAIEGEPKVQPERSLVQRIVRGILPIAEGDHGRRFFVRDADGRWQATRLLLVLLVIEGADVVFAFDSVPAVFGVARDPFLVFSSNILAILGLRALYFLLSEIIDRFRYINYGISAVLVFVGFKMVAEFTAKHFDWIGPNDELIPYWVSLCAIAALLAISIAASLFMRPVAPEPPPNELVR